MQEQADADASGIDSMIPSKLIYFFAESEILQYPSDEIYRSS